MKIIRNKYLPPKGYKAMTIGPYIFVRENSIIGTVDLNHEAIHWKQEKEMLILPFFIWYVVEFLIRYISNGFKWHDAYRNISFEQEAYVYQEDFTYPAIRKFMAWIEYI